MDHLIKYIENNLSLNLDTETLLNAGYVSHTQLYRGFYSLTGHPVREYIRKRRLSNALTLIKSSELSLADIAYRCGYSSQQALCRAVRQVLGLTPAAYKNGELYYFFPPFDGEQRQPVTVSCETISGTLCVMFLHPNLNDIENAAVNQFLQIVPDYGGRIFGRNGKPSGGKFCYELYLTDTGRDYKMLKSHGFKIEEAKEPYTELFAATVVKNDQHKINMAWDYLYSIWLQNSMFEHTNRPYCEEYILKKGKPVKLKLYLPIRKRGEDTKINLVSDPELRFVVAEAKGFDAEKLASKTVMNWLAKRHPYIAKTAREFYVRKDENSCVCGVRVNNEQHVTDGENIRNITVGQGNYLVLESGIMGDYDRYAELLKSFARDNGMAAEEKGIFAVYNAGESFEKPRIRMYCPLKNIYQNQKIGTE